MPNKKEQPLDRILAHSRDKETDHTLLNATIFAAPARSPKPAPFHRQWRVLAEPAFSQFDRDLSR